MYKYKTISRVGDHGLYVAGLVLELPETVPIGAVSADCFNVFVDRKGKNGKTLRLPRSFFSAERFPAYGYRVPTAAYASDAAGTPAAEGRYITLELDPMDAQAGCVAYESMPHNSIVRCDYRVTQVKELAGLAGLVFDVPDGDICPDTARWKNAVSSYAALPLQYGFYVPDVAGDRPLLLWLHGAGEGGSDPRVAYVGNRVTNLSSPEIQALFGGAYVLAPQAPTMWMDDGSHMYNRTGRSMYRDALRALLDEFVAGHAVDTDRIYIGGCSNGGFMTMRMLIDYPELFAAAFPMCEALYDETISDADIERIKNVPIWFVHAKNDSVVNPQETSIPTYRRLQAVGGANVVYTYINDDPPRPAVGHGCWVPGLANRCNTDFEGKPVLCNGEQVSQFAWIASWKKS